MDYSSPVCKDPDRFHYQELVLSKGRVSVISQHRTELENR